MGGLEVFAGGLGFGDLPGGGEVGEGAGADLDVQCFAGEADGFFGGVVLVEVDELLFLFVGECGEERVVAARTRRLRIGDFGLGMWCLGMGVMGGMQDMGVMGGGRIFLRWNV